MEVDEEEYQKFIEEINKLAKSIEDIPQMEEIQKTINEKMVRYLEDVNGYLIDEMNKMKSEMGKQVIGNMIKDNFKILIKIKETEEKEHGKKI